MSPARAVDGRNDDDALRRARSFLFVPGDRPDRFEKAARSGADLVVIDLEDAVPEENKARARSAVAAWLSSGGSACVRVNSAADPGFPDDLAALTSASGLLAVMLPKAEEAAAVRVVADGTAAPVIALIESAVGMAAVATLAAAPGVVRLAFGHLDYAMDLGAEPSRTAMLAARSSLVLASRVAGLPGPIDGVTAALDDADILEQDVRHAKELGMTGKLLVHPRQVEVTHAAFRPDEDAVRWARRVVETAGDGEAVRIDGEMVDAPVLARAHAILRAANPQ